MLIRRAHEDMTASTLVVLTLTASRAMPGRRYEKYKFAVGRRASGRCRLEVSLQRGNTGGAWKEIRRRQGRRSRPGVLLESMASDQRTRSSARGGPSLFSPTASTGVPVRNGLRLQLEVWGRAGLLCRALLARGPRMADQFLAPYPFYVAPTIQDSTRQLCELPEAPHKEERSRATVHDAVGSSHWNATGTSSLLGFNHFSNHPGHPFESSSSFSSTGDEFSDTSSFPLDGVHNLLPLDYAPIGGLSSAGLATPKAKPFILKLLYVLSHPEVYGDVLRWE